MQEVFGHLAGSIEVPVGHARREIATFIRDSTPGCSVTTELAQQSMQRCHVVQDRRVSHGTKMKNGSRTIGVPNPLHFPGQGFQCLVPGNPGKFAGTSRSCPLERIEKTVRCINALAVGMTSGTRERFLLIIGLEPDDSVSPDMHLDGAGAAAVATADGADSLYFIGLIWAHLVPDFPL